MLEIVKKALRIVTTDFDDEIQLLIDACVENMRALGVLVETGSDGSIESAQVRLAIVSYCKWQFGENDSQDKWRTIYDRMLAEMKMMAALADRGGE